ncbi:MAG: HDOD domain-containing protein [candidate division Zixibacteria bacterium]|nr:HDOD domain-containing protein [candidate division Zixibacteria bacterium]
MSQICQKRPALSTETGPLTLESVVAGLGAYPLPQTAIIPRLMRMTSDLNTDISSLVRVLASDPALVAKILQLSNSAFYGRQGVISSLNEAVMVLGFYTIRTLAVSASAYRLFRRDEDHEFEQELWRHSLAVGIGARLVARRVGSRQVEEEIFLCGVLHDIAKLVLLQEYPEIYKPVLKEAVESGLGHLIVESSQMGFTHADLGAIILEQWGFPPRVAGIVRRYNIPDLPFFIRERQGIGRADMAMPHMVCLAHEMANNLGYGFLEHTNDDLTLLPSAAHFHLDAAAIDELSQEMAMVYFDELGHYSKSMSSGRSEPLRGTTR